ncbi:response regulator [Hyphomicrobium sp. xq]|uniref:Response regulator n=1 Tax=Hyphomicrobium album TaxID=2665159 RepID=A0A6I3KP71_9HYPH|nr:response regulator transcription factor [Hyphomicrobium album]MTD95730.1 response regulator [Hyphomicrobium album]
MKALVIDDHPVVLQGCLDLLRLVAVDPVFLASDLTEGVNLYRRHKPDLIILDLSLGSDTLSGLNFLQWLRVHDSTAAVIVLTMHTEPGIARRAIEGGASAFVCKDGNCDDLLTAIRKVKAGEIYVSPELAIGMAFDRDQFDVFGDLTLRELDTLKLIGSGGRYEAIAEQLHVSYKTVVNIVSSLKRKLGAGSLGELTRVAITGHPGVAQVPEKKAS